MNMPYSLTDGPTGACRNCKKHKATCFWGGENYSSMDLIHGNRGQPWCECCTLKAQIEYREKLAATIEQLRKDLQKATCVEASKNEIGEAILQNTVHNLIFECQTCGERSTMSVFHREIDTLHSKLVNSKCNKFKPGGEALFDKMFKLAKDDRMDEVAAIDAFENGVCNGKLKFIDYKPEDRDHWTKRKNMENTQ